MYNYRESRCCDGHTHCVDLSTQGCCGCNSYHYNTQICCRYYRLPFSQVPLDHLELPPVRPLEGSDSKTGKNESDDDESTKPLPDLESNITEAPAADEEKPDEHKSSDTDKEPHNPPPETHKEKP